MQYLKRILNYRHLIVSLALKEIKIKYKSAVLGWLWSILHPLLLMFVFFFIFTFIIKMGIKNFPLFLLSALVPWFFLSFSLSAATTSIVDNSGLLKKAYFPQEVIPVAIIVSNLLNFIVSLALLFVLLIINGIYPTIYWLLVPFIVILQVLFVLGICFVASALHVKFRDVRYAVELLLIVWFYATPIFYPLTIIPDKFRIFFYLNPLALFVSMYRDILVYGEAIDPVMGICASVISVIIFLAGIVIFNKNKKYFVDLT